MTNENMYDEIIEKYSKEYNVDFALIKAVIKNESNFNPNVVSHVGATGLMQLMPSTAKGLGVRDLYNPDENIKGGTKELRMLLDRYNGDVDMALFGYNAGVGTVKKRNGVPSKGVQTYIDKVKKDYQIYSNKRIETNEQNVSRNSGASSLLETTDDSGAHGILYYSFTAIIIIICIGFGCFSLYKCFDVGGGK